MTKEELKAKFERISATRTSLLFNIKDYSETISQLGTYKSPTYSHTSTGGTNSINNSVARLTILKEDMEKRVLNYREKLDDCMNEFEELLMPISPTGHLIYRLKYLKRSTWQEIAIETGYCERQVRRIFSKDLDKILEYVNRYSS